MEMQNCSPHIETAEPIAPGQIANFYCARCGSLLAEKLHRAPLTWRPRHDRDGYPVIDQGEFGITTTPGEPEQPGDFILNLEDGLKMRLSDQPDRVNGCCGLAGMDGMNRLCENGHEVGTEQSDCWQAHQLVLSASHVKVVLQPQK